MKANTFNSFFCFAFISLVFIGGLGLILLALNPAVLENWLLSIPSLSSMFMKIGGGCALLGVGFFFLFYQVNKSTYYQVNLEPDLKTSLNPKLITTFLDEFFKKHRPDQETLFSVKVYKGQLDILVDMSEKSFFDQEKELKSWERALLPQLSMRFGLPKKTKVSVICQKA